MYPRPQTVVNIICILLVIGGLSCFAASMVKRTNQWEDQLERFTIRCEFKGGVVLSGKRPGHTNWIGCYKGLTEVYNEE